MKKALIAFLYILGFMAAWAVVLLISILSLQQRGDEGLLLWFSLGVFAAILITFFPFFNYTLKKVFSFEGQGEPLPLGQLRKELLALNDFDVPVIIEERKNKLVATWKYVDAKWWEIFAKAGLTKIYELHMKFYDSRKEVVLIDVLKNVSWDVGTGKANLTGEFFRGVDFEVSIGKQWGIKENFTLGKIYDYKFNPSEIKNPVLNTLLRNGWKVSMGMW